MLVPLVGATMFLVGLAVGLVAWYRSKSSSQQELVDLHVKVTTLEQQAAGEAEKLRWTDEAEKHLREAFSSLAGEALRSNSELLAARAKEDIKGVITPLKENLTSLDTHVRDLEQVRRGAYDSMNTQLVQLRETHARLQESTTTLTQALKSPTVRGRWGEVQLRRVVELAGMTNHVDFDEQAATDLGRPDLVVYMPNGGRLPVDSKVPLAAYLAAMESLDDKTRKERLAQHAKAMRERVKDLSQKEYWDQFDSAPDFVVMFVPNEACLGAAFESDPGLLEYAIEKRVLISSPVNLVALLRAVAYGWQQHQITENAIRIAQEGKELYGRLEKFVGHLSTVGKRLTSTVEAFNEATGSLERRLVPAARRFQELGLSMSELQAPSPVEVIPSPPSSTGQEENCEK